MSAKLPSLMTENSGYVVIGCAGLGILFPRSFALFEVNLISRAVIIACLSDFCLALSMARLKTPLFSGAVVFIYPLNSYNC